MVSIMHETTTAKAPPKDWREARRWRGWELFQKGWKQKDIAEALGVTEGAVSQWVKRAKGGGPAALRHHPPPGAPARLTPEQRAQLPNLLSRGAETFGFVGDLWTQSRVATVIHREFGVTYHSSQVGRILKASGWSRQKPVCRAQQRDEAAIRAWWEERWPALEKKP
jgi:transposase